MIRRFKDKEPFGRVALTPTGAKMVLDDAAAARLNEVVSMLNRFEKMSVAGRVQKDADGNLYIEPEQPRFVAKITSAGPPYEWIEQTPGSVGGAYVDLEGGRQGTNAREYNGGSVGIGNLVEMELWPGGYERFVDDRQGETLPPEPTHACPGCDLPLDALVFDGVYTHTPPFGGTPITQSFSGTMGYTTGPVTIRIFNTGEIFTADGFWQGGSDNENECQVDSGLPPEQINHYVAVFCGVNSVNSAFRAMVGSGTAHEPLIWNETNQRWDGFGTWSSKVEWESCDPFLTNSQHNIHCDSNGTATLDVTQP